MRSASLKAKHNNHPDATIQQTTVASQSLVSDFSKTLDSFPSDISKKSEQKSKTKNSWGSLRPPSDKDVAGPRKRQRVFDALPQLLDYLVVLDFEWTADDYKKMVPTAEITQFPSVLMKLFETNQEATAFAEKEKAFDKQDSSLSLPLNLTRPSSEKIRHDALAVSIFDTFVRPTFNPKLSDFSIRLTAITQAQVDAAPTIETVLSDYMQWLKSLDLVNDSGQRQGNWCFVTWGDGDIMSTLRQELCCKQMQLPPCFDKWINLKSDAMFKKHYKREARGGLRTCVESVGAVWEGRAHNGLVDSINTAKIVRNMLQTGFRFTRSTRGLGKDGIPFGQKR